MRRICGLPWLTAAAAGARDFRADADVRSILVRSILAALSFSHPIAQNVSPPEFSLPFFQFLYVPGPYKVICTARDLPGTKTSGRNGKMDTFSAICFFEKEDEKPTSSREVKNVGEAILGRNHI